MEEATKRGLAARGRGRLLGAIVCVAGIAGACGGDQLTSLWLDRVVAIDGSGGEWDGALTDVEDEQVSVGLRNDGEYLYIALFVGDYRTQGQVLTNGFTVWFDPSGREERTFGIRYPLGIDESDRVSFMRAFMDGEDPDSLTRAFEALGGQMEIRDRGEGAGRRMTIEASGVELAMKAGRGLLGYELKVPLAAGAAHPYAIGIEPGGKLSVGVAAAEGMGLGARTMAELEEEAIRKALAEVNGNRRRAAERLGIGVRTLYEKLNRYGLR